MVFYMTAFCISPIGYAAQTAPEDRPSAWAQAEIASAVQAGIVPEPLQRNYQTNITRSQYVLMAMKVFALSGADVRVENSRPFSDISGHEYEEFIILAFNAGIVKGDGNGFFHPDAYITREEIASLVANLLARLPGNQGYPVSARSYEYADGGEISGWAKGYIDICFDRKILTGVGHNKILPKGNATVEQSIAMLYRLANKEGLLDKSPYGTLKLSDKNMASDEPDAVIIDKFTAAYGKGIFDILKELSHDENVAVTEMRESSATLFINNSNTIHLDKAGDDKTLYAMMHDINDELSVSIFRRLLGMFEQSDRAALLLDESIARTKAGEVVEVFENLDDNHVFCIETQKEDAKCIYFISYTGK